jgi:CRISPR-associated protein (TIGR03984 family)
MRRDKITCRATVEPAPIPVEGIDDVKTWLEEQLKPEGKYSLAKHHWKWLLAHTEQGVVWGRVTDDGSLITSFDAAKMHKTAADYCPELRTDLLQQARLFGDEAELLLWRDGDGDLRARLIREAQAGETPTWTEAFDEAQLLWGTTSMSLADGFTLLTDGVVGLRHAVPIVVTGQAEEPYRLARLIVRNYLKEDETGFVRVVASRLVKVEQEDEK